MQICPEGFKVNSTCVFSNYHRWFKRYILVLLNGMPKMLLRYIRPLFHLHLLNAHVYLLLRPLANSQVFKATFRHVFFSLGSRVKGRGSRVKGYIT